MSFSEETIQWVWDKAATVTGRSPAKYRQDKYGTLIYRDHYGRRDFKTGWEIDHSKPKSKGGTDHINNLQAMQWYNNHLKSNNY